MGSLSYIERFSLVEVYEKLSCGFLKYFLCFIFYLLSIFYLFTFYVSCFTFIHLKFFQCEVWVQLNFSQLAAHLLKYLLLNNSSFPHFFKYPSSFTMYDVLCHIPCILGLFLDFQLQILIHVLMCWYHIVLVTLVLQHISVFGKVNSNSLSLFFTTFLAVFCFSL